MTASRRRRRCCWSGLLFNLFSFLKLGSRGEEAENSGSWFSIHFTSRLLLIGTITEQEEDEGMEIAEGMETSGGGWGVSLGKFASHLLTVNHVVITVRCPLVYLPPEDIGPLLVTIGPNNQLSVCPLSDVIHITGLSPLCCPFSACDQSLPPSKQTQSRP